MTIVSRWNPGLKVLAVFTLLQLIIFLVMDPVNGPLMSAALLFFTHLYMQFNASFKALLTDPTLQSQTEIFIYKIWSIVIKATSWIVLIGLLIWVIVGAIIAQFIDKQIFVVISLIVGHVLASIIQGLITHGSLLVLLAIGITKNKLNTTNSQTPPRAD